MSRLGAGKCPHFRNSGSLFVISLCFSPRSWLLSSLAWFGSHDTAMKKIKKYCITSKYNSCGYTSHFIRGKMALSSAQGRAIFLFVFNWICSEGICLWETSMDRNRAKKLMVIDSHKFSFEVIIVVNCKKDQSQKSCVMCLNINISAKS